MKSQSMARSLSFAAMAVLAMVLAAPTEAGQTQLNLTDSDVPTGCNGGQCLPQVTSGWINGGYFSRDATQPAGTGVFNPFLRLDVKGNIKDEQGYNTNAVQGDASNGYTSRKILDNMSPVNWTHDVNIDNLNVVSMLNGSGVMTEYYQFKLDINEPGNTQSLLSLDGLKLIVGPGSQNVQALDSDNDLIIGTGGLLGNVVYDMDAGNTGQQDNFVMLDARLSGGPGSGIADMLFLVEKGVVNPGGANDGKNLILWSRFGLQEGMGADATSGAAADAGFEEWSFGAKQGTVINPPGPPPGAPTPASLALVALGLLLMSRRSGFTRWRAQSA